MKLKESKLKKLETIKKWNSTDKNDKSLVTILSCGTRIYYRSTWTWNEQTSYQKKHGFGSGYEADKHLAVEHYDAKTDSIKTKKIPMVSRAQINKKLTEILPARELKIIAARESAYAEKCKIVVYKTVAKTPEKLISVYDGKTEYKIGETINDTVSTRTQNICSGGGIFVHTTAKKAEAQGFPDNSAAADLPRVILKGYAWGKKNEDGKIAVEHFQPVEIVAEILPVRA